MTRKAPPYKWEILTDYADLEKGYISESLRYAAEALRERELPLVMQA